MNATDTNPISALKAFFDDEPEISLALLYGSFAHGTAKPDSDVDLAVHSESPLSAEQLMDLHTRLEALLHRDVDLLDLRQAEGTILAQVIGHCIRIKNASQIFARYNLKAIYFHEEYLPALRMMQDANIRRFAHGS